MPGSPGSFFLIQLALDAFCLMRLSMSQSMISEGSGEPADGFSRATTGGVGGSGWDSLFVDGRSCVTAFAEGKIPASAAGKGRSDGFPAFDARFFCSEDGPSACALFSVANGRFGGPGTDERVSPELPLSAESGRGGREGLAVSAGAVEGGDCRFGAVGTAVEFNRKGLPDF